MSAFTVRPPEVRAKENRAIGIWRASGPIGDLRRWRDETPEAIAIRAYRSGEPQRQISYGEYARHVERFAGAFYELGVRSGDVVAFQLPNWWQASALILAAARVGAVLAPVLTTIRSRELERVLAAVGASVCVTVDRWADFDHAAALREMAPRLSKLRHRVVLGQSAVGDEIGFTPFFADTPWERCHPVALEDAQEDPDRVAVVYFTSGTSGEPKGVLHSWNTLHVSGDEWTRAEGGGSAETFFIPNALMHGFAAVFGIAIPVLTGACTVLLDDWSGEAGLAALAETGTTQFASTPPYFFDLIAAAGGQAQTLPALRVLVAAGTTIPKRLFTDVPELLGAPLRAAFGMTEIGFGTWTRADDPPDWGTQSDGRPADTIEIDLRSDTEITKEQPGRLFVRGPGVCLCTVGRDSGRVTVLAEHDGWLDTGDLAVPDGRGGIRLMGRAGDRIGGGFMIPVTDVESLLLSHPGVADVALVGYPDGKGGELACAVVRPATTPPVELDELRKYLSDQGMTDWYLPSRLQLVATLPRNVLGKVRKELLRRWLRGEADLTDA